MFGHLLCILSIKGATEGKQPTSCPLLCEVCHDTLLQYLMELNHIMNTHMGLHMDYSRKCAVDSSHQFIDRHLCGTFH